MNYEVGKQYEMKVVDIRVDSAGYNYIVLHDDDPSKEYRVYNILKCQYESLPETLYVVVASIDAFGKIKFRQDEGRLNREHYKEGKLYAFDVTDVKEDINTKAPYYVIEDDFSSHRYFFKGEQKYNTGDSCILEVEGFTDKGFLKLKEVEHVNPQNVDTPDVTLQDDTEQKLKDMWTKLPILDVEDESQTLELKTSIVFPPGQAEPDIDKQLFNILKELTAFMNTDGGTLYIGVHDKTKKVIGIEGDFSHLNEGKDEYNGSYKEDKDGYELKIRNTMDALCPSLAGSLTTICFEELEGNIYCKIDVKPARRPIFLAGTQLFVRQGNRVKRLTGDEITFFVTERMEISIKNVLDMDGIQVNTGTTDIEMLKKVMRDLINERTAIPRDLPKPKDLGEVNYWFVWYQDGTWKKMRQKSEEKDVYIQVPVYKNMSDPLMVFCYDTNKVNVVKESVFRKGANMNILQTKNGWSKTGDKPMNIFVMHATDFLVGYSIDSNGIEYVKLHAISDYSPTASAGNQGSPFVPDTNRIETYAVIGAEHKRKVEHLVGTKAKRSAEAGTPLTSPTWRDEIEYLEKVLKGK